MARTSQKSWQSLALVSALSFGLAIFLSTNLDPRAGIPPKSELLAASGEVSWVQERKYGTRFGLAGVAQKFEYPSKANGMGVVRKALRRGAERTVSVRYEADASGPIHSDEVYHDVWEIKVGDRVVRSYAESAAAWESDNRLTPWLAAAMALIGFYLGFTAWQLRQKESAWRGMPAAEPAVPAPMIDPRESSLVGQWYEVSGTLVADDACRRIERLVATHLTPLARSEDGGSTLYRDPDDGRLWEHTFPQSQLPGGGPPCLRCVSPEHARAVFGHGA
jgi:hypothetical protein